MYALGRLPTSPPTKTPLTLYIYRHNRVHHYIIIFTVVITTAELAVY